MKLRRVNILRHGMWDDGRIGNSAQCDQIGVKGAQK